jgi:hypothetical protein
MVVRILSLAAWTVAGIVLLVVLIAVANGSVLLLLLPVALAVAVVTGIAYSGSALARRAATPAGRAALFVVGSAGALAILGIAVSLVALAIVFLPGS